MVWVGVCTPPRRSISLCRFSAIDLHLAASDSDLFLLNVRCSTLSWSSLMFYFASFISFSVLALVTSKSTSYVEHCPRKGRKIVWNKNDFYPVPFFCNVQKKLWYMVTKLFKCLKSGERDHKIKFLGLNYFCKLFLVWPCLAKTNLSLVRLPKPA